MRVGKQTPDPGQIRQEANAHILLELSRMLALELELLAACETALERLDDPRSQRRVEEFCSDHSCRIQALESMMRGYGAESADASECSKQLRQGRACIANLCDDQDVLRALNANSRSALDIYEDALGTFATKPDMIRLLKAHLSDERGHQHWLEGSLQAT